MKSLIAKSIKKIIKSKGYKQYAVGVKAGYSKRVFNDMLNERKRITDVDILNIANALEVSPNDLYEIKNNLMGEIQVLTIDNQLIASITSENIIEKDGYKVVCISDELT